MKKKSSAIMVILFFCLLPSLAFAGENVKYIFTFDPASIMVSSDLDGFYAQNTYGYNSYREEFGTSIVYSPSINAGIGFVTGEKFEIDGLIGYGLYYAEFLQSNFFTGKVIGRYKFSNHVSIGAEAGYISFNGMDWDGEWSDSSDISFSDPSGFLMGINFTAGIEKISFNMSVDYVSLDDSDITTRNNWSTSTNKLDLSGVMLNFGIICRF
jgi:hypothetical protein